MIQKEYKKQNPKMLANTMLCSFWLVCEFQYTKFQLIFADNSDERQTQKKINKKVKLK
jgi:hypothetical protein